MKAGLNMTKKDQEAIEGWVRNPSYTEGYRKGFIAGQEAKCDNCLLIKLIGASFRNEPTMHEIIDKTVNKFTEGLNK